MGFSIGSGSKRYQLEIRKLCQHFDSSSGETLVLMMTETFSWNIGKLVSELSFPTLHWL